MKLKTTLLAAAIVAAGSIGATTASAAVATGQFTVSLTVNATCKANTSGVSNITLAAVNTGQTTSVANGTFTVNCSKNTVYNVGLAPSGAATDGTGNLASGANNIAYALYQNTAGTTPWGNTATPSSVGNGETGTGSGMGVGNAKTFTVYANAMGSTDVPTGTYSDTVTINVNY